MSVLVDTSVWVEHFRRPLPALIQLLRFDDVLTYPLVMLELTCGTPPEPRARTLGDLALLRQTRLALNRSLPSMKLWPAQSRLD